MLSFCIFALGLLLGSFYNVVAFRLPRRESVAWPPSHCPGCGTHLQPKDLVPVLSYLWLLGRCRHCRMKISPIYPAGELATAFSFWLVYRVVGWRPELAAGLFLASVLVIASLADLKYRIIPNRLLIWTLLGGLALRLVVPLEGGILNAFAGIFAGGIVFFLAALLSKGGMGEGDVKLAACAGLFLGWARSFEGVVLSSALGALVGLILILFKIIKRRQSIPFAPFIALGFLLAYLYGDYLAGLYLRLFMGRL